ncbi:rRNA methyltransferase 3, mitochondrial isoform X2 [Topomyia yanbarensis]|uniref:rRNA methyltransferase 3, mitochondrial isoform X2 n=1 Tax=Topomyia yanbarensis TaxID=2498891 RepID=UPI00273B2222|nr:rRNA methyltransferase 3, mitochondrial isoform X2 [Topomyia yanbarensis]
MQFVKSFKVIALNVLNGAYNKRRHAVLELNPCRQEKHKSMQTNQNVDPDLNEAEHCIAESELEEIEANLFNNHQQLESFQMKKQNNNKSSKLNEEKRKHSKKLKKIKVFGENDLDIWMALKPYCSDEKSVELYDDKRKFKYLRLTQHNSLFRDLRLLISSRIRRELGNQLVLEGKRLMLDGLNAGLQPNTILFSDFNILDNINVNDPSVKFIQLKRHLLQELSDLVTSPGIIGIFVKPSNMDEVMNRNRTAPALPITVVCDNIREPNNLGSIIRSCASIPVNKIVLLKGCTQPWDSKCLRGGAGAHFRTSIIGPLTIDELAKIVPPHVSFLVADNTTQSKDERFVFRRYDAANYCNMKHMVLVIGGETHGISSDVRSFIANFSRNSSDYEVINYSINIPLENGIESLNTATAVSVILCEIRRQLSVAEQQRLI